LVEYDNSAGEGVEGEADVDAAFVAKGRPLSLPEPSSVGKALAGLPISACRARKMA